MTPSFDPALAASLLIAARAGGPRPAALPSIPPDTDAAYQVQHLVLGDGAPAWKMALLRGTARECAAIPASDVHVSGAEIALDSDGAIEVETAFILGRAITPGCTPAEALDAVAEVRLAFEFINARLLDRLARDQMEAMADSFCSAAIVLGDPIADWAEVLQQPLEIRLDLDGRAVAAPEQPQPLAETGPFLVWLAGHAAKYGLPLGAGSVIISGARIGPLPINGATHAQARIAGATVAAQMSAPPRRS
ncbi:fumarylacetoacetate hydrolase family protein [Ketogulonicigenium vulgare]|uniref:fumarylacetoacetate hydrolase family protein n=1 Tax=Ketogulonicigenium vulgare TaxID=92945 RepID=UPI0023595EB5|nr:fumarylacetoacetate hydrolase family protein [Ketogulonicigenium vulgare]